MSDKREKYFLTYNRFLEFKKEDLYNLIYMVDLIYNNNINCLFYKKVHRNNRAL